MPDTMCAPTSDTLPSSDGSMPRTSAPLERTPWISAWPSTYGAAPTTCGFFSARSTALGQSRTVVSTPSIVACETMPRMRSRSSPSKPFMTEITVMSAVTPTAMPRIDTSEMNEMK